MLGNGAFSKEEVERLMKAPNILADFFKRSSDVGWTVAAQQIRSIYWEIETHATRLRRMAKGWLGQDLEMTHTAKGVLNSAADELDRLAKFSVRRPISELRQEAFGKGRESGPDRWVVVWSGDSTLGPMVARWLGGRAAHWESITGMAFTLGGEYTHFSELPTDDPSVL